MQVRTFDPSQPEPGGGGGRVGAKSREASGGVTQGVLMGNESKVKPEAATEKRAAPPAIEMAEPMTPREMDLEARLKDRDDQVAQLTLMVQQLQTQIGGAVTAAGAGLSLPKRQGSPFAGMRPANMAGGVAAAAPRPQSPRPVSRATTPRMQSPRPTSPRAQSPRPGGGSTAFGSTVSTARRSSPGKFFHASMRGGPISEPLPQRGTTPMHLVKGPSLLTRDKFGAKRSEWERFKLNPDGTGGVGGHASFFEDDNPFNDPFQYRPFKGLAFPPSDYIGPDDPRETDELHDLAPNALNLAFVYGYCGRRARQNLFYNADGRLVYHTAALGIVYDKDAHEQLHFHGHDDDIRALDMVRYTQCPSVTHNARLLHTMPITPCWPSHTHPP